MRGRKRAAVSESFPEANQSPLKNHPDELWENGMNDYISHASNILEKFKDVVNWLKQSKGRGDNVSPESTGAEKKQLLQFPYLQSGIPQKMQTVKMKNLNRAAHLSERPKRRVLLWSMKSNANFMSSQRPNR
ncbi:uncharacterized protein LOC106434384 isoform X3 [Brassica napus]|uniref:uncharacterized protein LOC106434384 isoform X3 n=1 Tax=Brassica napus TaxID=3708 RepID=UPI00207862B7|nr:uncharacterized protein LOC106434384 isoform X3 [Brassica napus]